MGTALGSAAMRFFSPAIGMERACGRWAHGEYQDLAGLQRQRRHRLLALARQLDQLQPLGAGERLADAGDSMAKLRSLHSASMRG